MYEYHIEGGFPVKGTIKASGNKNAALPCLAATLLTDECVTLRNIPKIEDTGVMIEVLKALGAKVENPEPNVWKICAENVNTSTIPRELSKKIRASILFAG
ncbi:MAG: UDP-N-acetylglucosamine 1-carboxyvinyltransferase, partial [Treponema sp.]|nr:UDP-N-acetylglucosamine 1-carboxyvinyltransferase [Treponema sp.]